MAPGKRAGNWWLFLLFACFAPGSPLLSLAFLRQSPSQSPSSLHFFFFSHNIQLNYFSNSSHILSSLPLQSPNPPLLSINSILFSQNPRQPISSSIWEIFGLKVGVSCSQSIGASGSFSDLDGLRMFTSWISRFVGSWEKPCYFIRI